MAYLRNLRRKIADSEWVNARFASGVARYLAWCHRTGTWEREGLDALSAAVRDEAPVIVALWHQRLLMTPFVFDLSVGPLSTLTSSARAGRMAGAILGRFGFDTLAMSSRQRHVALSREVLRRYRAGHSLGIATDGPRGPARVASTVPLVWARTTGARVFVAAYAQKGAMCLPTWDRMMLPRPYGQGVLLAQEWTEAVPRSPSEAEMERLRLSLEAALDRVTDQADALCR